MVDRSKLDPEVRKIFEELDTLDFKATMARETPDLYTEDEIGEMAIDLPHRLAEVAEELQRRFYALPIEVQQRARYEVHHHRDMTDVREWIEHMNETYDWLNETAFVDPDAAGKPAEEQGES